LAGSPIFRTLLFSLESFAFGAEKPSARHSHATLPADQNAQGWPLDTS
jgi:hypothetical protein